MSSTTTTSTPFLSMGKDTYRIPLTMFANNRRKLVDKLLHEASSSSESAASNVNVNIVPDGSFILIKGGPSTTRYDSDHEPIFRQESYMWWLTGVKEPDVHVVIEVSSNSTSSPYPKTTLFIPKLPPEYATIMGKIRTLDEWKELYQVDNVYYNDELESMLQIWVYNDNDNDDDESLPVAEVDQKKEGEEKETTTMTGGASTTNAVAATTTTTSSSSPTNSRRTKTIPSKKLLLLEGKNSDSGSMYEAPILKSKNLLVQSLIDTTTLFPILAECRVIKSNEELKLMQIIAQISSMGHVYVMKHTKPNMMEYQCESLFQYYCYYNYGCRLVSYTSICACGPNPAILHYGHAGEPNSRQLKEHDTCLFDMGAEYFCYASDITCSFPVNGIFSKQYKPIYEAVLNAQIKVFEMSKPGVSWTDCHIAAEIEIIMGLYKIGIIKLPIDEIGIDGPEAIIKELVVNDTNRLGAVFMPHGLGHFIGIDTHDVGGYLPGHPPRSNQAGLKSLRTARILQENMVLTNEPGCYFIDHLLDEIYDGGEQHKLYKYIDFEKLQPYRGTGGVRLEDVFVITKDGCHNYTTCPRTIKEVEFVMNGGKWPPTTDEAPELKRINLTKSMI